MSNKFRAVVALIAAVLLLASSTFAMHQLINKVNEFTGKKDGKIVLHDDFDHGKGKKDVYVENCGDPNSDKDIYVRIKFREAMNLTSYTWRPSSSDPSHWVIHTYNNGENCVDCQNNSHMGEKFHTYFQWVMGGQKYYMPASGGSSIDQNITVYTGAEAGVKQTPNAAIITSAAYLAKPSAEQDAFIGWICDTDGYAYWSQPIEPGKATGLLLSQVNRTNALKGKSYYYAIDVVLEAVDYDDIRMLRDSAASTDENTPAPAGTYPAATDPNGKAVIDIAWLKNRNVTTTTPSVTSVTLAPKTATYTANSAPLHFTAVVTGSNLTNGTGNSAGNSAVIWSISPDIGATISNNGDFTASATGGYTITIKAKDDETKTDTAIVNVVQGASYGVTINGGDRTISVGDEIKLTYTATLPVGDYHVDWSTGNAAVIDFEVDDNGYCDVVGLAQGSTDATVTITIGGATYTNSVTITVLPKSTNLPVKSTDPDKGYTSHKDPGNADETCWFKSDDAMVTIQLDEPGAFRLEDILVNMDDADGLTVAPVNSAYNGKFSIGSARTATRPERADKMSILYTAVPDKDTAWQQFQANNNTLYPITTQLILTTKDGRTATITVTMEHNHYTIVW